MEILFKERCYACQNRKEMAEMWARMKKEYVKARTH